MPTPSSAKARRSASSASGSSAAPGKGDARKPAKAASSAPAKKPPGKSVIEITNYASALRWLYSHTDYESLRIVAYNNRTFNLERMRRLLGILGNPQDELKCVQVAGTKGKGSTCTMLASMLQACGYGVGLYTSPHLIDLRERVTINGQMISHGDLTDLFKQIAAKYHTFGDDPHM